MLVELFSKDDCHLCDVAHAVLASVQREHAFNLRVVKLREGDNRFDEFRERFPVVFVGGEFAFQHRVPERAFIDLLRQKARNGNAQ